MAHEEYNEFIRRITWLDADVAETAYYLGYTEPELLDQGTVYLLINTEEGRFHYVEEEDFYDVSLDADGNAIAEDVFNMVYTALTRAVVNKLIQEKRG